jgi:hypothetical protein
MGEIYAHIPINIHPHVAMTMVQRKWNLRGLFFLDTWPMSNVRQLVITDPVSYSFNILTNGVKPNFVVEVVSHC